MNSKKILKIAVILFSAFILLYIAYDHFYLNRSRELGPDQRNIDHIRQENLKAGCIENFCIENIDLKFNKKGQTGVIFAAITNKETCKIIAGIKVAYLDDIGCPGKNRSFIDFGSLKEQAVSPESKVTFPILARVNECAIPGTYNFLVNISYSSCNHTIIDDSLPFKAIFNDANQKNQNIFARIFNFMRQLIGK